MLKKVDAPSLYISLLTLCFYNSKRSEKFSEVINKIQAGGMGKPSKAISHKIVKSRITSSKMFALVPHLPQKIVWLNKNTGFFVANFDALKNYLEHFQTLIIK